MCVFVGLSVCVFHMHWAPTEVSVEHRIPGNWNDRELKVLIWMLETGPLQEQQVLSTSEPSLWACYCYLLTILLGDWGMTVFAGRWIRV